MANILLTIQQITNETLRVLTSELQMTKNVTRTYDDAFAKKGAKIGNTLQIRKPARYNGRRGANVSIEAQTDTYVPLTLNTQYGVDVAFTSTEMALSLDDWSNRVAKPAMVKMANDIDSDGFNLLNSVYNTVGIGGTALTSDFALNAGVLLDQNLAPRGSDRSMIVDPSTQAFAVKNGVTLFNPSGVISEQYEKGEITKAYGFDWFMDQNAPSHAFGTYTGGLTVNGGGQTGSSLVFTGTASLNIGDTFTIAGVYAVNPQTKVAQPRLQQFVVTAANAGQTLAISPAISPVAVGNAFANVTAAPATGATITPLFASGAVSQLSTAFHKDAFCFATADLGLPGGTAVAAYARDPESGLSIRVVQQYDINTDRMIMRFDLLGGWATLYETLAAKIITN